MVESVLQYWFNKQMIQQESALASVGLAPGENPILYLDLWWLQDLLVWFMAA